MSLMDSSSISRDVFYLDDNCEMEVDVSWVSRLIQTQQPNFWSNYSKKASRVTGTPGYFTSLSPSESLLLFREVKPGWTPTLLTSSHIPPSSSLWTNSPPTPPTFLDNPPADKTREEEGRGGVCKLWTIPPPPPPKPPLAGNFTNTNYILSKGAVGWTSRLKVNSPVEFYVRGGVEAGSWKGVVAKVIHSGSERTDEVSLEKGGNSLEGYRCTFYPPVSGRFSVSLYKDRVELRVGGDPLEINASRNYALESAAKSSNGIKPFKVGNLPGTRYWGLATHPLSHIVYVTDRESCEVVGFDPTNSDKEPVVRYGGGAGWLSLAASEPPSSAMFRPTGLAVDGINKRILVCDKDNHRIVFFAVNGGHYISSFGKRGEGDGEFCYPWDVAVSPDSTTTILVSDSRNHRIQLFDRNGHFIRKFSLLLHQTPSRPRGEQKYELEFPRGVAFDRNGSSIYVSDYISRNVFGMNLEMTEVRRMVRPEKMGRPQGISVDDQGNLLICDSGRNFIKIVTAMGEVQGTVKRVGKHSLLSPANVGIMAGGKVVVIDAAGYLSFF